MEEWATYKLGEIAECSLGKMLDQRKNKGKPRTYLGNVAVRWGSINIDPTQTMLFEDHELDKYSLKKNDIVICEGGEPGRCAIWKSNDTILIQKALHRVRVNAEIADPLYVYYYITHLAKSHLLEPLFTGSTIKHLPRERLVSIEIRLPDLSKQKQISSILATIDDKRYTNSLINDNLERQLQCLYREWFIENPKADWPTVSLSEIATFISGYSYKGNELVENSNTAMATIKNFERNGGFKVDGYKPIVPSSKLKVEQQAELFDILVAHTDLTQNAEVIGNAEILLSKDRYKDLIFSMDLVKVNAKESFPFQFLLALLLKNHRFKSHCIGYVNGTTVLHMNKRALPDYETIIPNSEDAQSLNATAKAIFCHMSENLTEISNLTKTRDTLLPKLMSGELKINETDC